MNESQNKFSGFSSTKEILSEAKNVVLSAPELLRNSIEPYFVSRYFVAIYEARNGEIPIQVWNEYRNALDHLFRYLVASDKQEEREGQIKSAQKHFLRAALDILKLHTHRTQDAIKGFRSDYSSTIFEMVDSGEFIKNFDKNVREAEKLYEDAKISDLSLGDDHLQNCSVLTKYLDAAFAFENLRIQTSQVEEKMQLAQKQHNLIHDKAHKHSFFEGIKIHLVAGAIGSLLTLAFQYKSLIVQYITSLLTT